MAIAELIGGTEAVSTTEWSLATDTSYDTGDAQTTDGIFQCFLDLNDLVAADIFEFKVYEKCRSADTQRLIYIATFADVQATPIWVSPSLVLLHGWDMTLQRVGGTDATIQWSIRQVS